MILEILKIIRIYKPPSRKLRAKSRIFNWSPISYKLKAKSFPKGFTLIEVLLYVAIVAIIFGGIVAFAEVSFNGKIRQDAIIEVESNGNRVMAVITQYIRNAKSVASPTASTTSSTLNLVMADAAITPVIFSLSGSSTLLMSEKGLSTTTVTSSRVTVSNILFTNMGGGAATPGSIRFRFNMSYNNPSGIVTYGYSANFVGAASLRPN